MGLIELQRTFQPNAADYTFFSSAYGKFSMIDHNLENKTSLNTFKKIKTISGFFFFFATMIIIQKKAGKITNMWKLNSMLFNSYWI